MEAIQKFAKGDLNPWLETRQIFFLQDHWEPFDLLVSPLTYLMPLHVLSFLFELFVILVTGYVLVVAVRCQKNGPLFGAFLFVLFLLNRDLFEVAYYPIHPSTWAIFPLMLLTYWIYQLDNKLNFKKTLGLWGIYFLLVSSQEQFAATGVGLVIAFLIFPKTRKIAVPFSFLVILSLWWLVKGREIFLGELFVHSDRIKWSWTEVLLLYKWDVNQLATLVRFLLSYLPLYVALWFSRGHWNKSGFLKLVVFLGAFGPLLMGRIMTNSFGLHYNMPIVVFMMGLGLILITPTIITRKFLFYSALFTLLMVNNKMAKAYRTVVQKDLPRCMREVGTSEAVSNRQKTLESVLDFVRSQGASFSIIVSGNLVPNFIEALPESKIFQLGAFEITSADHFDWIVLERGVYGDSSNAPLEAVEDLVLKLKGEGLVVHKDTPTLFVAQGSIPWEWVRHFYYDQHYRWLDQ